MRRMTRTPILLSCAVLALALPGCGKKASGQVAAVVNGDEITLQQINGELGDGKLPEGAQKDKVRNLIVQRLVDKQLLEQQAKQAGLDRDPEFLMRQRQLNQALLLEFYAKRAQDTLRVPDQAKIAKFIADNPGTFANRTIFTVEQLNFPPADKSVMDGLKDLHSLDAIAQYLQAKGIKAVRATNKIDSAQVPPQVLQQVTALPAGEPFVIPTPQGVVVSVIIGREAAPLPAAQAQPMAVQMIRGQELNTVMQQRLKDARAKAKIEYQPGFSPPAAPK